MTDRPLLIRAVWHLLATPCEAPTPDALAPALARVAELDARRVRALAEGTSWHSTPFEGDLYTLAAAVRSLMQDASVRAEANVYRDRQIASFEMRVKRAEAENARLRARWEKLQDRAREVRWDSMNGYDWYGEMAALEVDHD